LHRATGRNIVVSSAVSDDALSLELRDLSIETTIDTICRVLDLRYQTDLEGIIRIIKSSKNFGDDGSTPVPLNVLGDVQGGAEPTLYGSLRLESGTELSLIGTPDGAWQVAEQGAGAPSEGIAHIALNDAPLAGVVALLHRATGRNLVLSKRLPQTSVTLELGQLPLEAAIETLCRVQGLWYRSDAYGIIRIMDVTEYRDDLVAVRDAQTRFVPIRYPSAVAVAEQLAQLYGDRIQVGTAADRNVWTGVEDGAGGNVEEAAEDSGDAEGQTVNRARAERLEELVRITVDEAANTLALRSADGEALDALIELIAEIDQPTRQILLEVKILQVRLRDGEDTAVGLAFDDGGGVLPAPFASNGVSTLTDGTILDRLIDDEIGRLFSASAGAATAVDTTGGGLVYRYLDEHLQLSLEALAQEDRLSALGTPMVLCANNREAVIDVGEERPIVTDAEVTSVQTGTDGNNNPVFTTVQTPTYTNQLIGTSLTVRPRINHNRTVTLEVEQTSTTLNEAAATLQLLSGTQLVPTSIDTVTTSSVSGTVVARHGLTLIMGGLVQESLVNEVDKVPLLGDIPFLGALFSDRREFAERSELIVLFTPYLLDSPATGGEDLVDDRLEALSRHPWNRLGDDALDVFGRDAAPQREEALWYVPVLAPVPEFK
jgi:general secretion pathway protein D